MQTLKAAMAKYLAGNVRGLRNDAYIANNRANRRKRGQVNAHKNKPRNIASRKPKR